MNLYYYRPAALALSEASKLVTKYVRRQPHTRRNHMCAVQYAKRNVQRSILSKVKEEDIEIDIDVKNIKKEDLNEVNDKGQDNGDTVDSSNGKSECKFGSDDEKMSYKSGDEINLKLNEPIAAKDIKIETSSKDNQAKQLTNCRKRQTVRSTYNLSGVIEKLIARVSEKPVNVTSTQTGLGIQFSSSSRSNELFFPHQHVSPRKRILREFEKVSLEDRNSSTQKRSRSKSSASTDFAMTGNTKPSGSNYSIVVAQHTASIACNNKEENNQLANGTPPRNSNSMDTTLSDKSFKASRTISSNASKSSQSHPSNDTSLQPVSKPISNYSIISLLGHNNSSNNSDRNETNTEDKTINENRRSPRSPMSYNHQVLSSNRSTFVPKKKSPTNSGNVLVNSPTNYRNTRSPDINSPSPGLQQNSHHNRYHPASLSSPTSSFHPYLSSSRASPLSSGTLSPTDLYRHRSYRTTASPSTMSNSSVSGLTHQYTSLNGSPTAFANRYSPSTYSSSTKTSPTQSSQTSSLSSAYNVSNLLPQTYDVNTSNVSENQRYSPNAKHRTSDWSPARSSVASGRSSPSNYANSNNSLSTTTIPKKTASIRQKYGSLSPNGFTSGIHSENALPIKMESNSAKKPINESIPDSKPLAKRSKSPPEPLKKPQAQEIYEKDLQARYNAEIAAMHHQSLIASALQQQAASPFYHMYAGNNLHGSNMPPSMSAAAAAAYMNPLYYHHPASEIFRKTHPSAAMDLLHKNLVPSWMDPYNASSMMHYPQMSGSALIPDKSSSLAAAKSQNEVHSMLVSPYSLGRSVHARDQHSVTDIDMWNATDSKKSPVAAPTLPVTSAFRRQSQQFSDCEPISLIKDEPSSGKYIN